MNTNPVDSKLVTILSWPRPHGSTGELAVRGWLQKEITNLGQAPVVMAEGCIRVSVGKPSTVLFSSHIDTVDNPASGHWPDNKPTTKSLTYDPNMGIIALAKESPVGECLGADDGAGVWLMLKMIEAKVGGTYIFHTGEERGGIGSRAMLKAHQDFLAQFEIAVAFDRPHETEIITHQGGQECASDKCGLALATALNAHGMKYELSQRGSFTDTKVYRGVIDECFNVGVGYDSQHGRGETQNWEHLEALAKALILVKWDALPIDRDCSKPDPAFVPKHQQQRSFRDYLMGFDADIDRDADFLFGGHARGFPQVGGYPKPAATAAATHVTPFPKSKRKKAPKEVAVEQRTAFEELSQMTADSVLDYVLNSPESATSDIRELILEVGRLRSDVSLMTRMLGN